MPADAPLRYSLSQECMHDSSLYMVRPIDVYTLPRRTMAASFAHLLFTQVHEVHAASKLLCLASTAWAKRCPAPGGMQRVLPCRLADCQFPLPCKTTTPPFTSSNGCSGLALLSRSHWMPQRWSKQLLYDKRLLHEANISSCGAASNKAGPSRKNHHIQVEEHL